LAVRVTDGSGEIAPLPVAAPEALASEYPGVKEPFASLDVRIDHPDYQMEIVQDVQIFPGVTTLLPVRLLPLPEQALPSEEQNTINIPPQSL